jgi:hypothetical protein
MLRNFIRDITGMVLSPYAMIGIYGVGGYRNRFTLATSL